MVLNYCKVFWLRNAAVCHKCRQSQTCVWQHARQVWTIKVCLNFSRRMQPCWAVDGLTICWAEVSRAGSRRVFVSHNDRVTGPAGMIGGDGVGGGVTTLKKLFEPRMRWKTAVSISSSLNAPQLHSCVYTVDAHLQMENYTQNSKCMEKCHHKSATVH